MDKISFDSLKRFFTPQVLNYFAGIMTGLIVRAVIGLILPFDGLILNISSFLFIIFATATIVSINQRIDKNLSRFSARVHYITQTKDREKALYEQLGETIHSAKKSVFVITIARQAQLRETEHRRLYYEKLDKMLEEKHKRGESFHFERIVQVKNMKDDILEYDQMDPLIYRHCQFLLDLKKSKSSVKVHLRQLPDGICPIAFFIVDNEKIVFLIPHIAAGQEDERQEILMGMGIFITDPDRILVDELMQLFEDLKVSDHARNVHSMSTKHEIGIGNQNQDQVSI